ncbi:MAG: hypothetical protein ACI4MH_02000, partial [Candidatus Coproplasma sp.]
TGFITLPYEKSLTFWVQIIVGFLLAGISSHGILSQLGLLIGRGTLLSLGTVFFVLPGLLYLLDWLIKHTTLKSNFYNPKRTGKIKDTKTAVGNCVAAETGSAIQENTPDAAIQESIPDVVIEENTSVAAIQTETSEAVIETADVRSAISDVKEEDIRRQAASECSEITAEDAATEVNPTPPTTMTVTPPKIIIQYRGPVDSFISSLTEEEKVEFCKVFIVKEYGDFPTVPDYQIDGDNHGFFCAVFADYGRFRRLLSRGLLRKIYANLY